MFAKTSNGCYFTGMFSGKEQTSLRKMLRDEEFKAGKNLSCCLVLIRGCTCHIVESGESVTLVMSLRHQYNKCC